MPCRPCTAIMPNTLTMVGMIKAKMKILSRYCLPQNCRLYKNRATGMAMMMAARVESDACKKLK